MSKSTHFTGQPLFGQILRLIDKDEVLKISRKHNGERYVKTFTCWDHLTVMLYGVLNLFDSLREITTSMLANSRYLEHLGISNLPRRSTFSEANTRRSADVFRDIYMALYRKYKHTLSADSRTKKQKGRLNSLKIIDSTTITLFSNLIYKGAGRNPIKGKKKGGIKVHTIIHANENVPSDIQFTSAATNDQFMLVPEKLDKGDLIAMDRAYINYEKFQQMTERGVLYVTKMKKNLRYRVLEDVFYQNSNGLVALRIQTVEFEKKLADGTTLVHKARILTYPDEESGEILTLLTNDFEMEPEEIREIYKRRWQIETLFRQIKQNFPLRYFYGESKNAIQIQIWVTLIANLLLTVLLRQIERSWSFSGFATIVRILLMSYVDLKSFFEHPERDWQKAAETASKSPPEYPLFQQQGVRLPE